MKSVCKLFILVIAFSCFGQVVVNLIEPPPGMWNIEDAWSLTLSNVSGGDIEVYLRGTADESRRGRIYEATSASFPIRAGEMKNVRRTDVEPVDIDFEDEEIRAIAERTGELPEGSYTICIYCHLLEDGSELGRDCYNVNIERPNPPELISPDNGASVSERLPVFTWLPPMPMPRGERVVYDLKIVEILAGQVPEEAISSNPAFFQREDISATSIQYPTSAREFEGETRYAWQIKARTRDGRSLGDSPVWSFTFAGFYGINIDSFFLDCLYPGSYSYRMYISNPNGGTSELITHAISSVAPNSPPPNPVISPTPDPLSTTVNIPSGGQLTVTGTVTTDNPVSKICIVNQLQDPANSFNMASRDTCFEPIECPDCCKDFEIEISDVGISMTEDGAYNLNGTMTAGPNEICEVAVDLVAFKYTWSDSGSLADGCKCDDPCIWPASAFGNFTAPATIDGQPADLYTMTLAGAPVFDYSRRFTWQGATPVDMTGKPFAMGLLLPDARCCTDNMELCVRFSFTDVECITCDTVVTIAFSRCPLSEVELSLGESYNEGYRWAFLEILNLERSPGILPDNNHERQVSR